jgi:hypothetical protein
MEELEMKTPTRWIPIAVAALALGAAPLAAQQPDATELDVDALAEELALEDDARTQLEELAGLLERRQALQEELQANRTQSRAIMQGLQSGLTPAQGQQLRQALRAAGAGPPSARAMGGMAGGGKAGAMGRGGMMQGRHGGAMKGGCKMMGGPDGAAPGRGQMKGHGQMKGRGQMHGGQGAMSGSCPMMGGQGQRGGEDGGMRSPGAMPRCPMMAPGAPAPDSTDDGSADGGDDGSS